MPAKLKERRVLIRSGFGVAIAAMGFLALGHTSPAFAQAGVCTGNDKISKQIAKPMAAAQDAQKAKKWQEVLAKTREAEATQFAKTAWDQHWMHEFRGYAYSQLGQYPEATREYEAGLAFAVHVGSRQSRALQDARHDVLRDAQLPQGHRLRQSRAQGRARSGDCR